MGQGEIRNMVVCPCLSLPEPVACLQLAGAGATKWQVPARNKYVREQGGYIQTVDTESSNIWLGRGDFIFGEDGSCWEGMKMGHSD